MGDVVSVGANFERAQRPFRIKWDPRKGDAPPSKKTACCNPYDSQKPGKQKKPSVRLSENSGTRGRGQTSIPSLILISGPFYHAVTQSSASSCRGSGIWVCGTNRIESDCDGTSTAVSYTETPVSALTSLWVKMSSSGASNHSVIVVDNALVVLVGSMGEVHANLIANGSDHKTRRVDMGIKRTGVHTGPSKPSQPLGSVDLGPYNPT